MTRSEIIRRWKNGAEPPKKMVGILAELNGCDKKDIVKILYEEGQLNGTAIYQYKKSGMLPADTDEVTEELTEDIAEVKQPAVVASEIIKAKPEVEAAYPEEVIELISDWLEQNEMSYNTWKNFCKKYEKLARIMKEIRG